MATRLPVDSGLDFVDVEFQDFFPYRTERFHRQGNVWVTSGSFLRSGDSCFGTLETDNLHLNGNVISVNKTRPIIGLDINEVPVKLVDNNFRATKSSLISSLGRIGEKTSRAKYTQDTTPQDSDIPQGALWLNINTRKLSIYYDSDWSELN